MASILGKYQHVRNENMDEYFAAVGVPYIPRKLMCMSSPSLEISQDGDEWTITNSSTMRTTVQKFKMGEEFEEVMPNGEKLKNLPSLDGNALKIKSTIIASGVDTSRIYLFNDEGCEVTYAFGELTGKRFFKRV